MADKKNGAKHLTSLDFDIRPMQESLQKAKEEIERYSIESGKAWLDGLSKSIEQGGQAKFDTKKILDKTEIEEARKELEKVAVELGKFSKLSVSQKGEKLLGEIAFDNKFGEKLIAQYELVGKTWERISTKQISDTAKAEKAQEDFYKKKAAYIDKEIATREREARQFSAQLKAQMQAEQDVINQKEKLREDFYKKNTTFIDAEIAKREQAAARFAEQLKEQMQQEQKSRNEMDKTVLSVEKLIEKQKAFNTLVSKQKTSRINKEILKDNKNLIDSLKDLNKQIKQQGYVTEEQKKKIDDYRKAIAKLGGTYEDVGTKGHSFLRKTMDKAYWLGAFYVVNNLKEGFLKTIDVIKSTEDAVVDLQRVLNDNTISDSKMSKELYDISYSYGRTFDEVSEVSTAFAQAGYDWNDTLELTKGTMLALNTAELDVTQSTQGLISILKQWNLEAEDYADVIDKINITADNFAINSENIVAALQRTSSSAKNANFSLEQTIGVITALGQATGRSGENIGTALNSLIIYTSNTKALETFAKVGSSTMKQVVDDYKKGAVSIYDVWVQLSQEIGNLTAQQQSVLFQSEMYQQFANELESQATEYTSEIKDIYGAAGTYRQNYFIALLNDLSTAQDAIQQMTKAEGYSVEENQKYMETLTAYWNQLSSVLAELAVQLGEAGVMSMLKGLTQTAIALAKATKDVGGIIPVSVALLGVIITINKQKLSQKVERFVESFKNLPSNIRASVTQLKSFKTATDAASAAQDKAAVSATRWQAALGWIGLAITAITTLVGAINWFNSSQKESTEKAIEANKTELERSENLANLVKSYSDIVAQEKITESQEEKLNEIANELNKSLGARAESLKGLKVGTEEYTKALNEATKAELENRRTALENQKQNYGEQLSDKVSGIFNVSSMIESGKDDLQVLKDLENQYLSTFKTLVGGVEAFKPASNSAEDVYKYYAALKDLKNAMEEAGGQSQETAQQISQSYLYEKTSKVLNELGASFNNYLDSIVRLNLNEQILANGIPKTVNEFENLKKSVFESAGANESLKDSVYKLVEDAFPQLAEQSKQTTDTIKDNFSLSKETVDEFVKSIDSLNSSIDSFQSNYNTLTSAVEEYNTTGALSIDTIQALIKAGSEYISLLQFTADGVTINQSALDNLASAQARNIDEMIKQSAVADALQIVQKYLGDEIQTTGDKASNSMPKLDGLSGEIQELIVQAWEGSVSVNSLANEISRLAGDGSSVIDVGSMQKELSQSIGYWKDFSNNVKKSFYSIDNWNKGAAASAKSAAKSQTDSLKKELEAQKKAIKDRYDAQIEALKNVQKENDRLQKQEEYYRNRQEALKDISKASTRSGIEYREQEEDARQKLEELDRSWQQTVQDWSIEDKIKELEALRDAEIAALDAQIQKLNNAVGSVGANAVKASSSANKLMLNNYEKEYLEPVSSITKKSYGEVGKKIPKLFEAPQNQLLSMMENNSKKMFATYQKNFFNPMGQSIFQMQQQMFALKTVSPTAVGVPFSTQYMNRYNQNSVTYNTNQNANIFANVYGNENANNFANSFFKKP